MNMFIAMLEGLCSITLGAVFLFVALTKRILKRRNRKIERQICA